MHLLSTHQPKMVLAVLHQAVSKALSGSIRETVSLVSQVKTASEVVEVVAATSWLRFRRSLPNATLDKATVTREQVVARVVVEAQVAAAG